MARTYVDHANVFETLGDLEPALLSLQNARSLIELHDAHSVEAADLYVSSRNSRMEFCLVIPVRILGGRYIQGHGI